MFDKHELYNFIKGKELGVTICIPFKADQLAIHNDWSHKKTDGDYLALALDLVFDNRYDAEIKLKELIELGKLKEKAILKNKPLDEVR